MLFSAYTLLSDRINCWIMQSPIMRFDLRTVDRKDRISWSIDSTRVC